MPKKIVANVSSLVDLKAELFRKQGEFQKIKAASANAGAEGLYVKNKKPLFDKEKQKAVKKTAGERSEKVKVLEEAMLEEERQLQKSKQRLIQKASLYEKLTKDGASLETDEEGNSLYLVNFDQKRRKDSSDEEEEDEPGPSYSSKKEDEEWVEFTDSFGRSRRCLRKDLAKYLKDDEKSSSSKTREEKWSSKNELLSSDMKKELERQTWEEEEEKAQIGPVHYQQVLKNEAWDHGVSYYQFSSDETERQNQMKLFDKMRKETEEQRIRNEKVREKRRTKMAERLEKVKERKKLKLDDDELFDDSDKEAEEPKLDEIPLPSSEIVEPPAKPKSGVRPWDVGKPKFSQNSWVDTQREERRRDFAPPSSYY